MVVEPRDVVGSRADRSSESRETTGASMNPMRTLWPAIAANFKAMWVNLRPSIFGTGMLAGAGVHSAVKLPEGDVNSHYKPSAAHSFRM
ncbi:unnamed protein product [Ilex paraguariensis]|uniref:Uncharacterized protein n=1 Tax=Ilex paraguariensis TaxID=185542 RepID=A0ABC8V0L8_9AQUA